MYSLAYLCLSNLWVKPLGDELPPAGDARNVKVEKGEDGFTMELPRGQFLFIGGDTAYHAADYMTLANRVHRPFCWAYQDLGISPNEPARPLFGIPGNHDYYDQLDGFRRQFRHPVRPEPPVPSASNLDTAQLGVAGFRRAQEASYVAVQLPFGWWLWGLDTEVGQIDERQRRFFRELGERKADKTDDIIPPPKLILATCSPTTFHGKIAEKDDCKSAVAIAQLGLKQPFLPDGEKQADGTYDLSTTGDVKIEPGQCRLEISGDVHQYARYWGRRYLSVTEVESALAALVTPPNDSFTQLITLPNKTWEDRVCHAIKIGNGSSQDRPGIYFLGGVHAREWGSPDILINFAQQLTQAYSSGTGISIGSKNFTASRIRSIMNNKDVYVFPQANPDGRNYSMTKESMWRKNRRPAPSGHRASRCVGVDINRNYDFLWDYPQYFDPQAPIANSTDPCDHDVYIGPRPISEPETKNAVWIFDTFPNIGYFIDVHSYSEAILYCWGDDVLQTTDPNMNFRNAAFNGQRGIVNDTAYKEYMEASDKTAVVSLATRMREAIKAVRGREYTVEQAISLYPTAGTSDDYAFSRHIIDSSKPKIYSYTIEWGSPHNPTPFHPPYSEMRNIIQEITAALLEFCWRAGA